VLILSGCGTLTEQYGFDKDGKVISYEKINADIIGSVMQSTKEKNVLIIDRGWAFGLVLSPGTPDDPTAHFKIVCGKFFRVWFSVIKDVTKDALEGMAKVIEAADAPLTASTGGVSEGANAK
jgi:hypothetical protein